MNFIPTKSGKRFLGEDGKFHYKCICVDCGEDFFAKSKAAKRCEKCRSLNSRKRQREPLESIRSSFEEEGYGIVFPKNDNEYYKMDTVKEKIDLLVVWDDTWENQKKEILKGDLSKCILINI